MNTKSSEVEEILGLGSFEKGLRAELRGRLRAEQGKMIAFAIAFVAGIVTGFLVSEQKREVN